MDEVKKVIPENIREKMTLVLEEYGKCGVIGTAYDKSGVPRRYHTGWLADYPDFKEMFEIVRDRFVDGLELVAMDRAKEKSDSLLMMMLKAHRKEVYGDTSEVNLKSEKGNGIQLVFASGMLSEDEKRILTGEKEETQ